MLSASLSRSVGAHSGLTQADIIEYLAAPNLKADECLAGLERLRDRAWYLHREGEHFYFKETENLGRRIERDARQVPAPKLEQALINRLTGLFKAQSKSRAAYHEVQIMPRLDDVKLSGSRILLVVQPDGRTPPEAIRNFYEFQQEKNNVLILSGIDSHLANEVEARLRELYAIEKIQTNLKPGDSPRVYVLKTNAVSEQDEQVQDLEDYRTLDATLYFIAVDSSGKHQTGEPTRWTADLTIRHEIHKLGDGRKLDLRCTPAAELRYSRDGTNPKEGTVYSAPFAVPATACTLLVAAKAGEVEKPAKIQIPADGDDRVIIDEDKPASIPGHKKISIDTTDKVFGFIDDCRERDDILLRGVQIIIGEGEHAVQIRFNERALTAAAIETAIRGVRTAIGDEQAGVQVTVRGGIDFGDGFALKQFAERAGIGLSAGDVEQD